MRLVDRRPPDLPHRDAPVVTLPDGRRKAPCPLCGELETRPRATWHRACVELWHLAAWPQRALAILRRLHGDSCWGCGRKRALELEHIRPLWSLTAEERLELRWWLPFNQQLLCRDCHRQKTAHEARERARKRIEAAGLQRLPLACTA